jgi:hypothetical protein
MKRDKVITNAAVTGSVCTTLHTIVWLPQFVAAGHFVWDSTMKYSYNPSNNKAMTFEVIPNLHYNQTMRSDVYDYEISYAKLTATRTRAMLNIILHKHPRMSYLIGRIFIRA